MSDKDEALAEIQEVVDQLQAELQGPAPGRQQLDGSRTPKPNARKRRRQMAKAARKRNR